LSVDPDVAETAQSYAFDGSDPLNAIDPLGLIYAWHKDPYLPEWLRRARGRLRNIINEEYRGRPLNGVRQGDGGTADMLRSEFNDPNWDGNLDSLGHYTKALNDINRLNKIIKTPEAYGADEDSVSIASELRSNLISATTEARALAGSVALRVEHFQQDITDEALGPSAEESQLVAEGSIPASSEVGSLDPVGGDGVPDVVAPPVPD
jgi:hypothetical protein